MSEHKAAIRWALGGGEFLKGRYSREHTWSFDGGLTVPASSSPAVVPPPLSNPANVDPEEALVASISSCHMLTYVWLAYREGIEVESYEDAAVGRMTKNELGVPWMSTVVLNPKVRYRGAKLPSREDEQRLHEGAHHDCFISQSVKSEITVRLEGDA
jgi:organic hydroperoxide reductase OsmC/OhrA